MKIALIGNMNNNNFALMRYFRDLGADAHLLLYSNDGKDASSHFTPESDTWQIEKWSPFIHPTVIPNAPIAAFSAPISWLFYVYSQLGGMINGKQTHAVRPVKRHIIYRTYEAYDCLVASGIAPAMLSRINRNLDLFYPYSTGIEFFNSLHFTTDTQRNVLKRLIGYEVKRRQSKGIKGAKIRVNAEMSATKRAFETIGVGFCNLSVPIVYHESYSSHIISKISDSMKLMSILPKTGCLFFHSARIMFEKPVGSIETNWKNENKNTDIFMRSFAELLRIRPSAQVHLLIVEYGPDIEAAKSLVSELEICDHVVWLPKMQRREVMWFLSQVDLAIGEFIKAPGIIWGGTGWEALAVGKPLVQNFLFEKNDFENTYGCPSPPILSVKRDEDILRHLIFAIENPEKIRQIGDEARAWFNRYQGLNLAKKFLDLLKSSSHNTTTS